MNVTDTLNKNFISRASLHLNFREFISQYSELVYENIKLLNTDNIPPLLIFDTLKLEIQKTNEKLSVLESYHFWVRPTINDDYFWDSLFVNDIVGRFSNKKIIEIYNNITISNNVSRAIVHWLRNKSNDKCPYDLNFPLFDELVNYIALLKYYNELLFDLEYVEQKHTNKSIDSANFEVSKSNFSNPTTTNKNMENTLFDDLHIYSTSIQNMPLESTTIERIIYLCFELFQEEFADAKSYTLQNALLNCKESAINVILSNLNKAINTKCGNNIDFSDVSIIKDFSVSYSHKPGETSIHKKYTNITHQPANFQLFRKIWLYRFIENIKEVRNAICTITGKPIIETYQPVNILKKIDEYQLFSNDLNERTNAIFKSNDDKANKLDAYFNDIFPEYIQSTNNILTLLEEMEKSFKSSLPALTEEYNKLVSINARFKKQFIESVEKLIAKILEIDAKRFFYEYFEAINFLETRLELENKQIASFFKTLEKRIKHISDNSKLNIKQQFDNSALNNSQPHTINIISVKTFATYLNTEHKETLIEKIRQLDRSTPKKIFIILKALLDNGILLSSDNNTIFEAYHNEFGYSKSFETLTRGLNYYDFNRVDKKLIHSIENMQNNLTI